MKTPREFVCDSCGADWPEGPTACPKCGLGENENAQIFTLGVLTAGYRKKSGVVFLELPEATAG